VSLLSDYKNLESKRIERLFSLIDKFSVREVDGFITDFFDVYGLGDYMKRAVIKVVKDKVSALFKLDKDLSLNEFIDRVLHLDDSQKRCLMVTILNDFCRLGVLQEADILGFVQNELNKPPK
jgi:hypothetical protein